ncbi:MAG: hypothetical protein QXD43_06100 [Candidatus Aenigmatarchaeota archaeon]
MPTISIFKFEKIDEIDEICKSLNGKKFNGSWFTAKPSKYSNKEVFINYWYYEDVEEGLKKVFSEDAHEIVSFLKENGKTIVLRRIYCFINLLTKTLEIYRGPDEKTEEIVSLLGKLLNVSFTPLKLKSEELQKIYSKHSLELKQVMFKNINGLIYDILRGNCLENNFKFKEYLQKFPECLRVISFRPKIKFLNSSNKYQVTINADRGTIKISEGFFSWRPRFEIRQIIFFLSSNSN